MTIHAFISAYSYVADQCTKTIYLMKAGHIYLADNIFLWHCTSRIAF